MTDRRTPDEQDDRRRLFKDVWGTPPGEHAFANSKDAVDMPPLVERGPVENARLEQLERSLRDARSEIAELRTSLNEVTGAIQRIARRLQLTGFSEKK